MAKEYSLVTFRSSIPEQFKFMGDGEPINDIYIGEKTIEHLDKIVKDHEGLLVMANSCSGYLPSSTYFVSGSHGAAVVQSRVYPNGNLRQTSILYDPEKASPTDLIAAFTEVYSKEPAEKKIELKKRSYIITSLDYYTD